MQNLIKLEHTEGTKELRSRGVRQLRKPKPCISEGGGRCLFFGPRMPKSRKFDEAPGPAHLPRSPAPCPDRGAPAPAVPCGEANGHSHPGAGPGSEGKGGDRGSLALTLRAPCSRQLCGASGQDAARLPAPHRWRKRRARGRHSGGRAGPLRGGGLGTARSPQRCSRFTSSFPRYASGPVERPGCPVGVGPGSFPLRAPPPHAVSQRARAESLRGLR